MKSFEIDWMSLHELRWSNSFDKRISEEQFYA